MLRLCKNMSTFISRVSPLTGKSEWILKQDNYDYLQEIARSAYADMLHDSERNVKYELALKRAIELMHERGKFANVLDIGTGTGLLSMMAVKHGADTVTACEAFKPVSDCARQVIKENGMEYKIHLIGKRSTDVTVGRGCDMVHKANILVTEVFDTELIGEGALSTFRHAHAHLLEKDCIVVPQAANMFAQVVHSDLVQRWNKIQSIHCSLNKQETQQNDDNCVISTPDEVLNCPGAASVHDLQLDQLSRDQFTPLSQPVQVFRFDFSGASSLELKREQQVALTSASGGTAHGVFMWWELEMDGEGKVLLSCAPHWAHPTPHDMPWRDHWMQAIYYPMHQPTLQKDQPFMLHACHDEYSLWFDVTESDSGNNNMSVEPLMEACRCGVHVACSRTRLGNINDKTKNNKFTQVLSKVINEDTVCLCLSDTSLLPLIAAKLGSKMVYALESHSHSKSFLQKFIKHNDLEHKVRVISTQAESLSQDDLNGLKINLLLAEPFYSASVLPWHDLHLWYTRTALADKLADKAFIMPQGATMRAIAVQFDHLWKIRAPVGVCEGFNISHFDKVINTSSHAADEYMEPQPLWEYPGKPLSNSFSLMAFDFTKPLKGVKAIRREGFEDVWTSGSLNGIAVWLDYQLDSTVTHSTGLTQTPHVSMPLQWYPHARQAVHLFPTPTHIPHDSDKKWKIKYKVVFKPNSGEFEFDFQPVCK